MYAVEGLERGMLLGLDRRAKGWMPGCLDAWVPKAEEPDCRPVGATRACRDLGNCNELRSHRQLYAARLAPRNSLAYFGAQMLLTWMLLFIASAEGHGENMLFGTLVGERILGMALIFAHSADDDSDLDINIDIWVYNSIDLGSGMGQIDAGLAGQILYSLHHWLLPIDVLQVHWLAMPGNTAHLMKRRRCRTRSSQKSMLFLISWEAFLQRLQCPSSFVGTY